MVGGVRSCRRRGDPVPPGALHEAVLPGHVRHRAARRYCCGPAALAGDDHERAIPRPGQGTLDRASEGSHERLDQDALVFGLHEDLGEARPSAAGGIQGGVRPTSRPSRCGGLLSFPFRSARFLHAGLSVVPCPSAAL